jgi:putative chitinase
MTSYTVHRGESLSAIARRFGTTWQELARINGLHDPNRLRVGQRIVLPGLPPAPAPSPRGPARTNRAPQPKPSFMDRAEQEAIELWQSIRAAYDRLAKPVAPQRPTVRRRPSARTRSGPVLGEQAVAVAGDVTDAQLRAIMPTAGARTARFIGPLNVAMRAHGINTNERRAAFLAQISVESSELHRVEEDLNYSAERLQVVWPRRFPNAAAAKPYAHDPEALANHTYANRLGNGNAASGDGWRYRGRGLMQTTGRSNYRAAGFESNPEGLANPQTAADSAGRFWASNGLNGRTQTVLARAQFNGISRTVNGGDHGSAERWAAYQRALRALQPAED